MPILVCLFALLNILALPAMAEEPPAPAAEPALIEPHPREDRTWGILGNYTPFGTWVTSKPGVSAYFNKSAQSTYEIEYLRGSIGVGSIGIDIAKIEEQRLTISWRSYGLRNSFNFLTGIYYNDLEAHIGSELLATITGNPAADADLLKATTAGFTWGLGNRWQMKNGFILGADWFVINVPILVIQKQNSFSTSTNNTQDRANIDDAMNFFTRFPNFSVLKIQLGMSF